MCSRYEMLTDDGLAGVREILKTLSLRILKDDAKRPDVPGNEVRPTNAAPVLFKSGAGLSFANIKWGFPKNWDGKGTVFNARTEDVRDTKMFSGIADAGRCVVPAGAFFEWDKQGEKRRHDIRDKSGGILFMAGLCRPTETGREFVILTKDAAGGLERIHDRMPVLLRADQIEGWLNGTVTPGELCGQQCELTVTPEEKTQLSLFDGFI